MDPSDRRPRPSTMCTPASKAPGMEKAPVGSISAWSSPGGTEYFQASASSGASPVPPSPSVIKAKLDVLERKLEKTIGENRELRQEVQVVEEEREKMEARLVGLETELKQCREEATRWKRQHNEKEGELETMYSKFKLMKEELILTKVDLNSIQATTDALAAENSKLQSDLGDLLEKLDEACGDKDRYYRECHALRMELENADAELKDLEMERKSVMDKYSDLNSSATKLKADYCNAVDKQLEDRDKIRRLLSEVRCLRSRQPSIDESCSIFNLRLSGARRNKVHRRTASLNDLTDESAVSLRNDSSGGMGNRSADESMSLPFVPYPADGVSLHQELLGLCYDRLSEGQQPGDVRALLDGNVVKPYRRPSPPVALNNDDEMQQATYECERLHRYAALLLTWLRSIVDQTVKLQESYEVEVLLARLPAHSVDVPKPDNETRGVHASLFNEGTRVGLECRATQTSSGYCSPVGDEQVIEADGISVDDGSNRWTESGDHRTRKPCPSEELDQLHVAVDSVVQILTNVHHLREAFVVNAGAFPFERESLVGTSTSDSNSQREKSSTPGKFRKFFSRSKSPPPGAVCPPCFGPKKLRCCIL